MSTDLKPKKGHKWFAASIWVWPGYLAAIDATKVMEPSEIHSMKFNDGFKVSAANAQQIGHRLLIMIEQKEVDAIRQRFDAARYSSGAAENIMAALDPIAVCHGGPYDFPTDAELTKLAAFCLKCGGFETW